MPIAEVVLQVRYDPRGLCTFCGEAPEGVGAQEWYDYLSYRLPIHSLSGGRAAFYMSHEELLRFKTMSPEEKATA
jgi:hypothetical protein